MSVAQRIVQLALFALVLLYAAWFGDEGKWVAVAVFALPPLVLALALPRAPAKIAFWAGMFALAWFSHGVMVAWTRAPERLPALAEVALALVVVFAASIPGLRKRFARNVPTGE